MLGYFIIFPLVFNPNSFNFMLLCVKVQRELVIYNISYKEYLCIENSYISNPSHAEYLSSSLLFLYRSSPTQKPFYIVPSLYRLYQYKRVFQNDNHL